MNPENEKNFERFKEAVSKMDALSRYELTRQRLQMTCEALGHLEEKYTRLCISFLILLILCMCTGVVAFHWYFEAQEDCKGQAGAAG